MYGKYEKQTTKANLKVGDYVRISKTSRVFKKGYMPNWSHEIFTVATVVRTLPVTYRIKEANCELIKGTFYEKELQKTQRKNVYEIEEAVDKQLFRGQPQTLVKWKGYPDSYNEWLYDKDLKAQKKNIGCKKKNSIYTRAHKVVVSFDVMNSASQHTSESVIGSAAEEEEDSRVGRSVLLKLFNNTCPKSSVVFFCQVIVLFTVICASIFNLSTHSEHSELWVSLLSSSLGYLLPQPVIKKVKL